MKKKWFTLYEMIIAMTLFFLVISLVMKFYVLMIWSKRWLEWRQFLVQNSYSIMERLQVQMKNYTIDYEEYFDRRLMWCDKMVALNDASDFNRDVGNNWYCDIFTSYWNQNNIPWYVNSEHHLYYCSSLVQENYPAFPNQVYQSNINLKNWSWCFIDAWMSAQHQSFGEYHKNFFDVNENADTITWAVNDDDDEDLWKWPIAIWDNEHVQELYLISKDNRKRIFIRRALISSGDFDWTGWADKDSEKRYTLQILKLRWFDIWDDHFLDNTNNHWAHDWQIDTRTCDYSNWFLCQWNNIWIVYSWYNLPKNVNDWRINMFAWNITLSKRNIKIYPTSSPFYSRSNPNFQINPYITVSFQVKLYWKQRFEALPNVDAYTYSLQTTFDTKNFY